MNSPRHTDEATAEPKSAYTCIGRSAEYPDTAGCWRRFVRPGMLPDIEHPRDRRDGAIARRNPIGSSRPGAGDDARCENGAEWCPSKTEELPATIVRPIEFPRLRKGACPNDQRAPVRQRAVRWSRARGGPGRAG